MMEEEQIEAPKPEPPPDATLRRLPKLPWQIIDNLIDANKTLEEIGTEIGQEPAYLIRACLKTTGLTWTQYVNIGKAGRPYPPVPEYEIDWDFFDRMCETGATKDELCIYFRIPDRTLERILLRKDQRSLGDYKVAVGFRRRVLILNSIEEKAKGDNPAGIAALKILAFNLMPWSENKTDKGGKNVKEVARSDPNRSHAKRLEKLAKERDNLPDDSGENAE
jgi:hypothetical protein